MKKIIALSLLLLSVVAFVPSAEAKTNTSGEPQINVQLGQNRRNQRTTRTYTRRVRVGRAVYRETYRVTYRRNGTTKTRLVSRTRIR